MKKIVFFGDLLRSHKTDPFNADRRAKTLHELFRGQIAAATGVMPELALAREDSRFDRKKFYSLSGHGEPSEEGWIRIASGECDRPARAYFAECFRGALVISHEAGSLIEIMNNAGIDYVDFRVAPIRFLDDIRFCFKSNVPDISKRLLRHRMELDDIIFHANRLRARYCSRMNIDEVGIKLTCAGLQPNSLLLCGQSEADLSLTRNGRLVTLKDCLEKLDETVKKYDHIYYKKHPTPGDRDITGEVIRTLGNVQQIDANIYRMLCDDNLAGVAALSSGVLTEARFFGKRVHFLSHEYIALSGDRDANGTEEYVMTSDEYFSPTFWSDILSPCIETKPCRDFNFFGRTNMMRNLINGWWGYEPEHGAGPAGAPNRGALRLIRRIVNKCDPEHAVRRAIDPTGSMRRWIVKFLSP